MPIFRIAAWMTSNASASMSAIFLARLAANVSRLFSCCMTRYFPRSSSHP